MIIRFIGNEDESLKLSTFFSKNLSDENKLLLIDSFSTKRNIPIYFDIQDEVIYDIYDYLNGDVDLFKAMVEVDDNLDIIASSYYDDKKNFKEKDIGRLIDDAYKDYEYIIIYSSEEFSLYDFGEDCKNIIICREKEELENNFKNIKGKNYLIIGNRDNLIKDISIEDKNLIEEQNIVIGIVEKEFDDNIIKEIYENFREDKRVDLKKKSIIERIKEVFQKND